jgi:hypothetical protein
MPSQQRLFRQTVRNLPGDSHVRKQHELVVSAASPSCPEH